MQKKLAMVILKAMEIREASYEEHFDPAGVPCGGSYKKTKDQAIREACRGSALERFAGLGEEGSGWLEADAWRGDDEEE